MSSELIKTLLNLPKHNVGSLNNWSKNLLNQGAVVDTADMDNYCLGELGFSEDGERIVKPLTASNKKGVLVASVEDYMGEYEGMSQFFNAVGERARVVYQTVGHRFECSNFVGENTGKPIKKGQVAHYDHETKKFIVSNNGSNHASYDEASNKYVVVDVPDYLLDGQAVVRFEITE